MTSANEMLLRKSVVQPFSALQHLKQQKRHRFQKAETHLCLLEDVKGLGEKGDIVLSNLSRARNELVPKLLAYYLPRFKGKAILPEGWTAPVKNTGEKAIFITPAVVEEGYAYSQAEEKAAKKSKSAVKSSSSSGLGEMHQVLEKLKALIKPNEPLLVIQKVQISKDDSKIFGSVSWAEIKTLLVEKFKIDCPKDLIPAEGLRIKETGDHQVTLGGSSDGGAQVTFIVHVKAI